MEQLKKLLAKKKEEGKELSPLHAHVKASILEDLMNHMDEMGADKVKGLKKVTVAAPDKEGLEHGLAKASELVEKGPLHAMGMDDVSSHADEDNLEDDEDHYDSAQEDMEEDHEGMQDEPEESEEELHSKIKDLQDKLAKKKK